MTGYLALATVHSGAPACLSGLLIMDDEHSTNPSRIPLPEAERVLATVTALGLDQESASREVTAGLVHSILALTSAFTELLRR